MQSRASSGLSTGAKWPGAELARYMLQYANARWFRCTACGQSMSPGAGAGTKVVRARLPGLPAASFAATGLGLRPRCAIVLRVAFDTALFGYLREIAAVRLQYRGLAGEG